MKTRNRDLDIVRGLAIYLVVLGHLLDLIGDPAAVLNLCHLATFFFVSGYLLFFSLEHHPAGEVLRGRVRNLLIPYLCWSAVSFAANAALLALRGGADSGRLAGEFVEVFLRARSVWFLIQLLIAQLFLILCRKVAGKGSGFWALSGIGYLLLFFLLPDEWLQFGQFKRLYVFLLAGYLAGEFSKRWSGERGQRVKKTLPLLSLCYPVLVFLYVQNGRYGRTAAGLAGLLRLLPEWLIGGLGVALLFAAARAVSGGAAGRVLEGLGQFSIDIYVAHMFLIKFLPIQALLGTMSLAACYAVLILYAALIALAIWFAASRVLRKSRLYCLSVGR